MKNSYDQFFKAAKSSRAGVKVQKQTESKPQAPVMKKRLKQNSRSGAAPFPFGALITLVVGLGVSAWGYLYPQDFLMLWDSISVQAIGSAGAADSAEKKSDAKVGGAAESSSAKTGKTDMDGGRKADWTEEDFNHFSKLNERKLELDQRESELAKLEEELQRQKLELESRMKQLEEIRRSIASRLDEKVKVDEEKVMKLVEVYKNMKAQDAAKVVGALDEDLAVEILDRMKQKNAAEILGFIPAEKAKVLSEKLTGYQRR